MTKEDVDTVLNADQCPDCGGEVDTGWECNDCGKDWYGYYLDYCVKVKENERTNFGTNTTTTFQW